MKKNASRFQLVARRHVLATMLSRARDIQMGIDVGDVTLACVPCFSQGACWAR